MKIARCIVGTVVVVGAALFVDYWAKCHGAPLSRDEALQRAKARAERFTKSHRTHPVPEAVKMEFDRKSNVWLVTFEGTDCEIIIITDRCHGDDVGGARCG
jgi:hypothetical protein